MDELDRRLSEALGAQRLPAERAEAMARRATQTRALRWASGVAAAAAIVIVTAVGFLGGPIEAEAYSVITRLDQVQVVRQKRRIEGDYVVPPGQYVRIGNRVAGPGTTIRNGRIDGGTGADFIEGLQHFQAERWDDAASAFATVPTADGRFYRVAALGRGRRLSEAVTAADEYLASDPAHAGADLVRFFRAIYLRDLGRGDAALRELRGKLKGDLAALVEAHLGVLEGMNEADAAFYRIAATGNRGEEAKAIELIDDFVKRWPAHSGADYALYFKAVYLQRAGRVADARATCRFVLERYPDGGMGAHVRALLENLR